MTAGEGITIEGQTISASGASSTIKRYILGTEWRFSAFKQVVTDGNNTFVTFTFNCNPNLTEIMFNTEIKQDLEKFVGAGMTVSNGAVSITNDGTSMKLIKSAGGENENQQGTFTFFDGIIQV